MQQLSAAQTLQMTFHNALTVEFCSSHNKLGRQSIWSAQMGTVLGLR